MDYERAYNDALEKARFLRQQAAAGGNPLMANRYEQIFPQLAESEDERIRKELISLVRMHVSPNATCLVRGGSTTRQQAVATDDAVVEFRAWIEQWLALAYEVGFNNAKKGEL